MYGVFYDGVFGEFTGIRYEPSFSGYKEDIVLEKMLEINLNLY